MTPSDLRLLRGLRAIAGPLAGEIADPAQAENLRTVSLILDELLKRQRTQDRVALLARGHALIAEAEGLGATAAGPSTVDGSASNDLIETALFQMSEALASLTEALALKPAAAGWLKRTLAWESDAWAAPPADAEAGPPAALDLTPARIEGYLAERFPGEGLTVRAVHRVPGGYSKVTALISLIDAKGAAHEIVLRAQKPVAPFFMDGADIANEFPALQFAHASGVPVARPLWLEPDAGKLGLPFFATTRLAGRNQGDFLGSQAPLPPGLVRQLIATMAGIHATPIDPADPALARSHLGKWAQIRTLSETAKAYVAYWRGLAARGGCTSSPALARAFEWLAANAPQSDEAPVLVHGDFGLHNVLVEDDQVSGVLDWEACYIGDPADEFYLFTRALGAHASPEQIMAWYREAGGREISGYRLRYYAVLSALKGPITGIAALNQVAEHPDLELKPLEVAYRFVTPSLELISELIEEAEQEKQKST